MHYQLSNSPGVRITPPNTNGFYSTYARKLVLFDTGNKGRNLTFLYHEGFHQYLHYYLEWAPSWFDEGHGDFFGGCRKVEGKKEFAIRPNYSRLNYIRPHLEKGYYYPLPKLLTMTRGQLYNRRTVGRNYAQAWSFVYFLWNFPKKGQGKYFPVLKKYFVEVRAGRGLQEVYDRTFGRQDMEKMEAEWKKFIIDLRR